MHTFYSRLSDSTWTVIYASVGGALMKKTTYQAYRILEDMATNSNQWPRDRVAVRKIVGGPNLDVFNNLAAQVFLLTNSCRNNKG